MNSSRCTVQACSWSGISNPMYNPKSKWKPRTTNSNAAQQFAFIDTHQQKSLTWQFQCHLWQNMQVVTDHTCRCTSENILTQFSSFVISIYLMKAWLSEIHWCGSNVYNKACQLCQVYWNKMFTNTAQQLPGCKHDKQKEILSWIYYHSDTIYYTVYSCARYTSLSLDLNTQF